MPQSVTVLRSDTRVTQVCRFLLIRKAFSTVFYYNEAKSQIRFRLCKTLADFHQRKDLNGRSGSVWHLQLATLARNPRHYDAALSLLKEEFQIAPEDVDPDLDGHRTVVTFSPERLVPMNQRILNISGMYEAVIQPGGSHTESAKLHYRQTTDSDRVHTTYPFPSGTRGVLYYRQSQVAPTQVGELRFRICSDIHAFEHGSDLCLPTGETWFVSSQALRLAHYYQAIREYLAKEGLFQRNIPPAALDSIIPPISPHVAHLREPFVVDLRYRTFTLALVTLQPSISSSRILIKLGHKPNARSRRVVVHLEEYPSAYIPKATRWPPLLAMRILEIVEPTERFPTEDDSSTVGSQPRS